MKSIVNFLHFASKAKKPQGQDLSLGNQPLLATSRRGIGQPMGKVDSCQSVWEIPAGIISPPTQNYLRLFSIFGVGVYR